MNLKITYQLFLYQKIKKHPRWDSNPQPLD